MVFIGKKGRPKAELKSPASEDLQKVATQRPRRRCLWFWIGLPVSAFVAFIVIVVLTFLSAARIGPTLSIEPESLFLANISASADGNGTTAFTRATATLLSRPILQFASPHILPGKVTVSVGGGGGGQTLATFDHEFVGLDLRGTGHLHTAREITYTDAGLLQIARDLAAGNPIEIQLDLDTRVEVLEHLPSLPLKQRVTVRPRQMPSASTFRDSVSARLAGSDNTTDISRGVIGATVRVVNPFDFGLLFDTLEGVIAPLQSGSGPTTISSTPRVKVVSQPGNLLTGTNVYNFQVVDGQGARSLASLARQSRNLALTITAVTQNGVAVPIVQRVLDSLQVTIPLT